MRSTKARAGVWQRHCRITLPCRSKGKKHISANTTLEGRAGAELPYREAQRGRSRQTLPGRFIFPYNLYLCLPFWLLLNQTRAGMYFAQNIRMYQDMLKKGLYILSSCYSVRISHFSCKLSLLTVYVLFSCFPVLHLRTSAWQHLFFPSRFVSSNLFIWNHKLLTVKSQLLTTREDICNTTGKRKRFGQNEVVFKQSKILCLKVHNIFWRYIKTIGSLTNAGIFWCFQGLFSAAYWEILTLEI